MIFLATIATITDIKGHVSRPEARSHIICWLGARAGAVVESSSYRNSNQCLYYIVREWAILSTILLMNG